MSSRETHKEPDPCTEQCSVHGNLIKRETCRQCNAAYFTAYNREHRRQAPELILWEKTRSQAKMAGVDFTISPDEMFIPERCPALGRKLARQMRASQQSPVLDRIDRTKGYVPGNVRVISALAHRLKDGRRVEQLIHFAQTGAGDQRDNFTNILCYLNREMWIRNLSSGGKIFVAECGKIEKALQQIFR